MKKFSFSLGDYCKICRQKIIWIGLKKKKNQLFSEVEVASGGIYRDAKQKDKCPPLAMDSQTAHQTAALIFAPLLFSWWLW